MAGCAEAVLFLVSGRWQLSLVAEVVNRGSAACLIGSLDQIRCVSTACMLHVQHVTVLTQRCESVGVVF
jgi:hypothetical protein